MENSENPEFFKDDLLDFLRNQSVEIWDKIEFSRKQGIRISETTITQNSVFDFWQHAKRRSLPVAIYEAANEKTNGNDLEILVETDTGYVMMAVQAKITNKHGKYSQIGHKVRDTPQVDLLLRYARAQQCFPGYMFYNYSDDFSAQCAIEEELRTDGANVKLYGCTLANAYYLKQSFYSSGNKWKTLGFGDVHPSYAIPFFSIVGLLWGSELLNGILHPFFELGSNGLKRFTREELTRDRYWKNLVAPAQIGFVRSKIGGQVNERAQAYQGAYDPKYRIIISREPMSRRSLTVID